jgi:isopenicillin-N N-acyltransferase-like protein
MRSGGEAGGQGERVRVIRVAGGPRARGRQAGEATADLVHRSLDFYRGFLEARGVGHGQLQELLRPYTGAAEAAFPAYVEEIRGLAEGAQADPLEVLAANSWEELEPLVERPRDVATQRSRCTAFVLAGPEGTVLGHNEQWYAGDDGNVAVIVAQPDDGPAFVSPTVVCCLPAVGLNGHGLAQAVMSLEAHDDGEGVPRVLVSRHALEAAGESDAVERTGTPGRAGGYAHMFAGPGGRAFTVETTARRHAVVPGPAGHTNHYLDPELAREADEPRRGSESRLRRLRTLLAEGGHAGPQGAMEILRDHVAEPEAICVHPDPAEGGEAAAVVFSMVVHLEERRMWVAPGRPCETEYEEIDLSGVLAG